ncbi:hypothetical protein O3S80_10560 [Streptomyces sp. Lzd4kr]|nr:hypothetical protein [Streptomyces sp. Lzd4kr]
MNEFCRPALHNCRLWSWTWAGNTPLRRWKRANCRGSDREPLHWPRQSGVDVLGIEPPDAIKGLSDSAFMAARRMPPGHMTASSGSAPESGVNRSALVLDHYAVNAHFAPF